MQTTGDQRLLKRINRSVLLRLTQQHGSLSRARMATHSGLTNGEHLIVSLCCTHTVITNGDYLSGSRSIMSSNSDYN